MNLLSCTILFLACSSFVSADTLNGRVISIADGDTLTIIDQTNSQHKIRLAGIDTPEKNQSFGQQAKTSLADLVFNQHINIDYTKIDQYGRIVGKIKLNGRDINLIQIQSGLAWHYKKYQKEQSVEDRHAYASAEDAARGAGLGLWGESNPVPPWDFRRQH